MIYRRRWFAPPRCSWVRFDVRLGAGGARAAARSVPQAAPIPQPAPAAQVQPLPAPASSEQAVRTTYRLGPDDQIMIQVADVPDISGKPQRIDPNGDLKLPMVGRVHAAGMTIEQLEAELITRFKVYIKEPDVAVTVTEFHSQPVSVIGAVGTSGVQSARGAEDADRGVVAGGRRCGRCGTDRQDYAAPGRGPHSDCWRHTGSDRVSSASLKSS